MDIHIIQINNKNIAEIISDKVEIANSQDALDILANCNYQGAANIIVYEQQIIPGFFDLKTGIAGEVLQKFSTYNSRLAIVGDFSKYDSKSLKDFMYESNKTGRISFVGSMEEAKSALAK